MGESVDLIYWSESKPMLLLWVLKNFRRGNARQSGLERPVAKETYSSSTKWGIKLDWEEFSESKLTK